MQKKAQVGGASRSLWRRSVLLLRVGIGALAILVLASSLFLAYSWIDHVQRAHQQTPTTTVATNGSSRWVQDKQTTVPAFSLQAPGAGQLLVDPQFQQYYTHHAGASSLGAPLTPGFPVRQGWIQLFVSGALLLPSENKDATSAAAPVDDQVDALLSDGLSDPTTGVVNLPLIQALLTVGSQVHIGAVDSPLTYVDLRAATNPTQMVSPPQKATAASTSSAGASPQSVFIAGGTRAGQPVGHLIPGAIWNYINRVDVSPDGWQTDLGAPLTEALPFTLTKDGVTHQMLAQVFWRGVLLLDQSAQDASGNPTITRLDTGLAFLQTLGPPDVALVNGGSIWSLGDMALLNAPATGQAAVHIGQGFPLTLLGDGAWNAGTLWYHVQWQAPKTSGAGWAPASGLTFTPPGSDPAWASFDVLSPDLEEYLVNQGNDVAAVAYDVTRGRYYSYNKDGRSITGSSMKVVIMLTLLNMTESQGREPNDTEMALLTTMIENSNNDAASTLYYNEIGGASGVNSYLNKIGITGLDPGPNAWGDSTISPLVMTHVLTLLYEGKVLTQQDRQLAVYLMEHIEADQQFGVGDSAPDGATVAMKNGWLQDDDGLWAVNSSGIVTLGKETYIISVYTIENNSFGDGINLLDHICGAVASALV